MPPATVVRLNGSRETRGKVDCCAVNWGVSVAATDGRAACLAAQRRRATAPLETTIATIWEAVHHRTIWGGRPPSPPFGDAVHHRHHLGSLHHRHHLVAMVDSYKPYGWCQNATSRLLLGRSFPGAAFFCR